MHEIEPVENQPRRVLWLKAGLLVVWLIAAFGGTFFARELQFLVGDWLVSYWFAAQGAVLLFLILVTVYAWVMNRWEADSVDHEVVKRER